MGQPERRADAMREVGIRINAFLRDAATAVRTLFQGKLTYASIQFEQVDWAPFDLVAYELIRSAEVAGQPGVAQGSRLPPASRAPVPDPCQMRREAAANGGQSKSLVDH